MRRRYPLFILLLTEAYIVYILYILFYIQLKGGSLGYTDKQLLRQPDISADI